MVDPARKFPEGALACVSQGDAGGAIPSALQYVPITNLHKATHVPYARTQGTWIELRMPIDFE